MESLMKQELQSQKLYDLLQNSSSGGHGAPSIEFIMRAIDQDELVAAYNQFNAQPPPQTTPISLQNVSSSTATSSNGITLHYTSPVSVSSAPSTTTPTNTTSSTTPLELDPNVVLHNFVNEIGDGKSPPGGTRPHVCNLCQASYKTRTHLRRHMMIHLNNRPYPCSDCGKGFNRKEHLNKHMEAVHSLTKHKCHFCGKEISRRDHLSRHIKNMHPTHSPLPHPHNSQLQEGFVQDASILKIAVPCAQKQKAQLSFLTPTPAHPPEKPSRRKSSNEQEMKGKREEEEEEEEEGSDDENSSSNSHSLPTHHHHSHYEIGSGEHSAEDEEGQHHTQLILDPESFHQVFGVLPGSANVMLSGETSSSTTSTHHILNLTSSHSSPSTTHHALEKPTKSHSKTTNHNNNGLLGLTNLSLTLGGQIKQAPFANCSDPKKTNLASQVFSCTECSSTFSSEKEAHVHSRSHKPQNYKCSECPRAYTRREKLTEHVRCFHQGQKFKCEHCGKELSRKDHVLRHVRSIHPELIASKFNSVSASDLHENLIVPIITIEEDPMNHTHHHHPSSSSHHQHNKAVSSSMNEMGILLRSICQYCLKVFGTSYHLGRHIESCHNGDIRPYPCSYCSKHFKRKDHLTKHIKSHCPSVKHGATPSTSNTTIPSEDPLLLNLQSQLQNFCDANQLPPTRKSTSKKNRTRKINKPDPLKMDEQDPTTTNNLQGSEEKLSNHPPPPPQPSTTSVTVHDMDMKGDDSDFNLALINSFMTENVNVNVVVEEEDLSSLLHSHSNHQQPHPNTSPTHSMSQSECVSPSSSSSSTSPTCSSEEEEQMLHQMSTFPCGHCQKEFSSRDQLLDHLQNHSGDESMEQDLSPTNPTPITTPTTHTHTPQPHRLRSIKFSNY